MAHTAGAVRQEVPTTFYRRRNPSPNIGRAAIADIYQALRIARWSVSIWRKSANGRRAQFLRRAKGGFRSFTTENCGKWALRREKVYSC